MKAITFVKGDITTQEIDCIVNAACNSLLGGGGVDGAIHAAAGPELLEYCKGLNGCETGAAVVTPAFNLPCVEIIHTVGPRYTDYDDKEEAARLLEQCYWNSLEAAMGSGGVAFPAISTGIFGYPLEDATRIAIRTAIQFLNFYVLHNGFEVRFMCFDDATLELYTRLHSELLQEWIFGIPSA